MNAYFINSVNLFSVFNSRGICVIFWCFMFYGLLWWSFLLYINWSLILKLSMNRKENYLQDVFILLPQKPETNRVRLTKGVNLVEKIRYARTTTAYAVIIKMHRKRAIYDNMDSTSNWVLSSHSLVCTKMCTIAIHSKIRISQSLF